MKLDGIGHVLLRVVDLERARKFYTEVLGFEVMEQDPEHGGDRLRVRRRVRRVREDEEAVGHEDYPSP